MHTPAWQRSSFCATNACVEVAFTGDTVLVRDSKTPDTALSFSLQEWAAFVQAIRAGDFD